MFLLFSAKHIFDRTSVCETINFLIAALIFSAGYYCARIFLQFKEFELYWGALNCIGVVILVTPKQEVERKSEWFCGVKFFRSKFKVEWENGVWTKIRFLASGFLFTCGNFALIFSVFSIFWPDFFLNGFPNPFIVLSRSSFLFSQWKFFELYVRTCPAMFFLLRQAFFRFTILPLFRHFAWNLFWLL